MLIVKDWFADKKCKENKRHMNSTNIFAIVKESEKAAYVMVADSNLRSFCFWCPKSQIETREDVDTETLPAGKTYDEYKARFDAEMTMCR
jgi:hypothetical protein